MPTRLTLTANALALLLLVISGCINYEQRTTLRADGSGTMVIHYWTEESVANFMSGDKLDFDGADIPQQYQAQGVKVKEAVSESNTKDSTRHMRVTLTFDSITALSNTQGFKATKFSFVRDGNTAVFKQVMDLFPGKDEAMLVSKPLTAERAERADAFAVAATAAVAQEADVTATPIKPTTTKKRGGGGKRAAMAVDD